VDTWAYRATRVTIVSIKWILLDRSSPSADGFFPL
jgi:hypothetical protein